MWFQYGLHKKEILVTVINLIGCILFSFYTIIYYNFSVNKSLTFYQIIMIIIVILKIAIFTYNQRDPTQYNFLFGKLKNLEKKKKKLYLNIFSILGIISCIFTILFAASPILEIFHLIKLKSGKSIQFPLVFMTLISSIIWLLYSLVTYNLLLQVNNL